MPIVIKKIEDKNQLVEFVNFGIKLYENSPYYVPPLIRDELNTFNKKTNPVFEFCESAHFLAYKDNKIVGRIVGIVNHKANEKFDEKAARFGWIDFIDDEAVSAALIEAVSQWAREKSLNRLAGPLGFCDQDPEGLLVEGFDKIATAVTIYNHDYYPVHLEKLGFKKDVDWVEYMIDVPESIPEKYKRIGDIVKKKYNLTVLKPTDRKKLVSQYGKRLFQLINKTYCDLYGYVELTDKQIDHCINLFLPIIRLDCLRLILDKDDNIVCFGISTPSVAKAMQKAKGKLFPFGWYHLLKALKGKNDTVELLLIGVAPEYQGKGVNALLFTELIPQYIENGYKFAESNPELEGNDKVKGQWDYFTRTEHKRRRSYSKMI